jgi:hypothetical protein
MNTIRNGERIFLLTIIASDFPIGKSGPGHCGHRVRQVQAPDTSSFSGLHQSNHRYFP